MEERAGESFSSLVKDVKKRGSRLGISNRNETVWLNRMSCFNREEVGQRAEMFL